MTDFLSVENEKKIEIRLKMMRKARKKNVGIFFN